MISTTVDIKVCIQMNALSCVVKIITVIATFGISLPKLLKKIDYRKCSITRLVGGVTL